MCERIFSYREVNYLSKGVKDAGKLLPDRNFFSVSFDDCQQELIIAQDFLAILERGLNPR
jgi:hypothetical protein